MDKKRIVWLAIVVLAVGLAYSNSFKNEFHFDDFHTITDNPAVQSLKNVPRFFTDATMFSVLPANRTYRPIVSTSLAIDYAMGRGYDPLWFHVSTFFWFVVEVLLLFWLYELLLNKIRPGPENFWLALFGAAWFGLHPAMAETVNYVIQRGDLYCTLGCVAALYLFAKNPERRKFGIYLLPFAVALLAKPPAAVFPVLLGMYVWFFERPAKRTSQKRDVGHPDWWRFLLAVLPAVGVTVAGLVLQSAMTPKTFFPSMISPGDYRLTQPYVWARYFGELFFPLHLNVDTDLGAFHEVNAQAMVGLVFVAVLGLAIWMTARKRILYPIAFGLLWFVVTQLPTSLYPLSEVENDHRMFFSFVGLILAVVWAAALLFERLVPEDARAKLQPVMIGLGVVVLCAYGWGVRVRNVVWHTEDSLWADDAVKSPHNGRGLMIYGLTLMNHGDYPGALKEFTEALEYTPNYSTLEINLGVVNGLLGDKDEAEKHYLRAITLDTGSDSAFAYYGRWLTQQGRFSEGIPELRHAIELDPQRPFQHDVLMQALSQSGDAEGAKRAAQETLAVNPNDAEAQQILAHPVMEDEGYWINLSLAQSKAGANEASIESAKKALAINPNSAAAYINIGAGYAALGKWDEAIANEREALRINPDYQLAKNNLALYTQQKAGGVVVSGPSKTAADYVNDSLHFAQAGKYDESIVAAKKALVLDPGSAVAWNNIAAAEEALHRWDEAIAAAQKAIALKPDFQLAKNNLAWSEQEKKAGVK